MLYRKSELKKHKYFLKSIHGLWILPIVIINLIVPLFNFFIYKLNNNDMVIDIEKIIFFFFPRFSVWTGVFVAEIFFSDKTKDVFFFFGNKKRFETTIVYFLCFLINALAVILLHFYCIDDLIGFLFKILSVAVFYYGLSMLVMFFSKSAPITIMVLLLYDLINTFVSSSKVFLLYENFEILTLKMFLTNYFPLIFVAIVFIVIVFKGNKEKFYLLTKKL